MPQYQKYWIGSRRMYTSNHITLQTRPWTVLEDCYLQELSFFFYDIKIRLKSATAFFQASLVPSKKNLYHYSMEKAPHLSIFQPILFPSPEEAHQGIVAITHELSPVLLYSAYLQGIFPWFNQEEGEPVVWWSPDPRFVLFPQEFHLPKRLKRFLPHSPFTYTMDRAFQQVITNCACVKRPDQAGTWIGPAMIDVYCQLFDCGVAHSVEVWRENQLVGGLYGVLVGQVFFGESMFSLEPETAKSAFAHFVKAFRNCGGQLIDSQVYTSNLARFGARNISRTAFLRLEKDFLPKTLTKNLQEEFMQVVSQSKTH